MLKNELDPFSRFDTTPACNGRTDRRTDGQTDRQTDRHRVIANTALTQRRAGKNLASICHVVAGN